MVLILKSGVSKKEIEAIRKKIDQKTHKGVDTKKFSGTIKLKEDPMQIQKNLRDEWE